MVGLKEIRSYLFPITESPEEGNPGVVFHNANKNGIFLSFHSTILSIFLLTVSWLQYGYSISNHIFTYQVWRRRKIIVLAGENVGLFLFSRKAKFPQDPTVKTFTGVF